MGQAVGLSNGVNTCIERFLHLIVAATFRLRGFLFFSIFTQWVISLRRLKPAATDNLYAIFKRTAQLNFQMIGGKNESVSKIRRINNSFVPSGIRKEKGRYPSEARLSV